MSIKKVEITKFISPHFSLEEDFLAVEEPLEIQLSFYHSDSKQTKSISITMRTPGHDKELAVGFLFTENILTDQNQIKKIEMLNENQICISLHQGISIHLEKLNRNFYTTSSCGVCGKSSLESIRTIIPEEHQQPTTLKLSSDIIINLKNELNIAQVNFSKTGGIHASALFDQQGKFITLFEDVGRHNALDKLIGHFFIKGVTNIENYILLLSGRASFELIQKAAMAGIKIVCAIGAPSSLAVEMAEEFGITLIGFLKKDSFNIYSNHQRII